MNVTKSNDLTNPSATSRAFQHATVGLIRLSFFGAISSSNPANQGGDCSHQHPRSHMDIKCGWKDMFQDVGNGYTVLSWMPWFFL
mmetsp:Transcript_1636/g.3511  ORF Transcript_1636/g.3511 Transcript_1636/m.3511 type:complete len:85 (-) Transcript_1636:1333-1587(-)